MAHIFNTYGRRWSHLARGYYAQAWSVGELLRVYYEDLLGGRVKLEEAHQRIFG